ncbi:MAG: AMP-binding protein [Treponema sp.]|jgi:long-chain acyl-CoA synthetase|nr:AMP-binding protein [Treponema sp.]
MLNWSEYTADWPDLSYPNFIALLDDIEKKWGEKTAIYYRAGKQKDFAKWSYIRFAGECRRVARGLVGAGFKKGDRVALWAENRPEWMVVWMASAIAGCVIVPIDYHISEEECRNIINITQAKAFFYSRRKEEFVRSLDMHAKLRICIDDGDDYAGFGGGNGILPAVSGLDRNTPVSVVFTSGTTGFAKGVTLSHGGIISNVSAAILALQPTSADIFINVLPLHHTYPTTCSFIAPLTLGGGTIIVDKLVGKVVIDDIRDAGGTLLIAVPLLYDKVKDALEGGLKKLPPPVKVVINMLRNIALSRAKKSKIGFGRVMLKFVRKKAGLVSMRMMVAGGGPLNPKTADFFESLGFNIFHGYGMSENGPLISVGTPLYKNNVSVGLPVKYTEVKIEDPDEYGVGEIVLRSPSLMLGYYENPQATKEVLTEEGWLYTGDLGYRDEKGFIYINGRKKNLIVSPGGKNIYPEEIEKNFDNSRVVGEILVIGRKGESGESIFAVVVPNRDALSADYPGKVPKEGELGRETLDFIGGLVKKEIVKINRTLAVYKKISGFTLRQEEFEKNAQRKIRRFLYKEYEKAGFENGVSTAGPVQGSAD